MKHIVTLLTISYALATNSYTVILTANIFASLLDKMLSFIFTLLFFRSKNRGCLLWKGGKKSNLVIGKQERNVCRPLGRI